MQTFLPTFESPYNIGQILDRSRAWKQVVECKQIHRALTIPFYGWQSHPAVRMWRGHEDFLLYYACSIAQACIDVHHVQAENLQSELLDLWSGDITSPPRWWGDERVASSHRSNLMAKEPLFYSQYGWSEIPGQPYFWPEA